MNVGAINSGQIEAMVAQLKAAAARMEANATQSVDAKSAVPGKIDFADALKASLAQVNTSQISSQKLGEKFALGDDKVSLSDVMISMQKANISFQTTVQVRNKLVSAYHDIMNMQI
jgi:flagellar hook-basal body complex protein FliE